MQRQISTDMQQLISMEDNAIFFYFFIIKLFNLFIIVLKLTLFSGVGDLALSSSGILKWQKQMSLRN